MSSILGWILVLISLPVAFSNALTNSSSVIVSPRPILSTWYPYAGGISYCLKAAICAFAISVTWI